MHFEIQWIKLPIMHSFIIQEVTLYLTSAVWQILWGGGMSGTSGGPHGNSWAESSRHGYSVIFVERQMLLRTLYQNLDQKHKVIVEKRVVKIELMEDRGRAITQDGYKYKGDIIIGADGMHSVVRKQMHRLGKALSPGTFEEDEYSSKFSWISHKFIVSIINHPLGRGALHL